MAQSNSMNDNGYRLSKKGSERLENAIAECKRNKICDNEGKPIVWSNDQMAERAEIDYTTFYKMRRRWKTGKTGRLSSIRSMFQVVDLTLENDDTEPPNGITIAKPPLLGKSSEWGLWVSNQVDEAAPTRRRLRLKDTFLPGFARAEQDVQSLVQALEDKTPHSRVILLYGRSGAGKSCVLSEALRQSQWSRSAGLLFDAEGYQDNLEHAESDWADVFAELERLIKDSQTPVLIVIENAEFLLKNGAFAVPSLQRSYEQLARGDGYHNYRLLILCAQDDVSVLGSVAGAAPPRPCRIAPYSSKEATDFWQVLPGDYPFVNQLSRREIETYLEAVGTEHSPWQIEMLKKHSITQEVVKALKEVSLKPDRLQLFVENLNPSENDGYIELAYSRLTEESRKLLWLLYCLRLPKPVSVLAKDKTKSKQEREDGYWNYVFDTDADTEELLSIARQQGHNLIQETVIYKGDDEQITDKECLGLHTLVARWLRKMHRASLTNPQVDVPDLNTYYRSIVDYCAVHLDEFLGDFNTKDNETIVKFFALEQPGFANLVYTMLYSLAQTPPVTAAAEPEKWKQQQEEDALVVGLYLMGHFWWEIYVEGFPLCRDLLKSCQQVGLSTELNSIISNLQVIQEKWPEEYDWIYMSTKRGQFSFKNRFRSCKQVLVVVYQRLDLAYSMHDLRRSEGKNTQIPSYRQIAKGLVEQYCSMAASYLGDEDAEKWLKNAHNSLRQLQALSWIIPFHDVAIADWHLYYRKDTDTASYWILRALEGRNPEDNEAYAGIGQDVVLSDPLFYYGAEYFNERDRILEVGESVVSDQSSDAKWKYCDPCAEAEAYFLASEIFARTGNFDAEGIALIVGCYHAYEYCYAPHPPDEYTALFAQEAAERICDYIGRNRHKIAPFAQRLFKFAVGSEWDEAHFTAIMSKPKRDNELMAYLLPPLPEKDELLKPELTASYSKDELQNRLSKAETYAQRVQEWCESRLDEVGGLEFSVKNILRQSAQNAADEWRWQFTNEGGSTVSD